VNYTGQKVVKDKDGSERLVPAVWPAIIEPELFDQVQQLMATNGRSNGNRAKVLKHTYVLNRGLLWCGACGGPMEGRSGTGRLGVRYYYYCCRDKACNLRVVADEIEGAVLDRIGVLAREEELLGKIVSATNERLQRQRPALVKRRRGLVRDQKDVKAQRDHLLRQWDRFTTREAQDAANAQLRELNERSGQLESALLEVDEGLRVLDGAQVDASVVRTALMNIGVIYEHLKPFEQQELVRLILHRAQVSEHKLVLEIRTGACTQLAQTPDFVNGGSKRFAPPERLPDQDSNLEPTG
jgi:hypothetical protein